MSTKICLKVMCPFDDCQHHFHRAVDPAVSEYVRKTDCKDMSSECSRYQAHYKENMRKSITSDLALIQHLRSGKIQ